MTFYNIFSNRKEEKKNSKTKIIVDFREKNSLVPSFLAKEGFEIEFQQLEIGDYWIKGRIIERKSISDLQQSIMNKRIFEQIRQMNAQQQASLLIIEGFSRDYKKILHPNALRGFFLSLSQENKIAYVFSEDEKETAIFLGLLANKRASEISSRPSRILKTKKEIQQFILEGFPNIGPVKAKMLLDKFKSLKNIFSAKKEELEEILGKKTEDFLSNLD